MLLVLRMRTKVGHFCGVVVEKLNFQMIRKTMFPLAKKSITQKVRLAHIPSQQRFPLCGLISSQRHLYLSMFARQCNRALLS